MSDKKKKAPPSLADLTEKPLRRSGQEIKAGSYPALFTGFGEPFYYEASFKGKSQGEKLGIRLYFLLRMQNGECERIAKKVNLGKGDPLAVNVRSTLYKYLRAIAGDNEKILRSDGTFGEGTTLLSFVMRPLIVGVKVTPSTKNPDQVFTDIETVSPPMEGLKYPTPEEAAAMVIPAEDEDNEVDEDDIPFE